MLSYNVGTNASEPAAFGSQSQDAPDFDDGASMTSRSGRNLGPLSDADAAVMAEAFRNALRKPDFAPVHESAAAPSPVAESLELEEERTLQYAEKTIQCVPEQGDLDEIVKVKDQTIFQLREQVSHLETNTRDRDAERAGMQEQIVYQRKKAEEARIKMEKLEKELSETKKQLATVTETVGELLERLRSILNCTHR